MRHFFLTTLVLLLASTTHATDITPAPTNDAPPVVAEADATASDTPADAEQPPSSVYLLARIQLTGTDFAQTAFLQDRTITSLEACEKQRTAGLTTGWQSYRHYIRTYKGVAYKVDYRCVQSEKRLSGWRGGESLQYFYLVRSSDNQLRLKRFDNFFDCRDALSSRTLGDSIDSYCAKASQRILD